MKEMKNPWLGLKTYEEGQILYGRTEEINTLSQNILFNIQTVIYGKSGIGKSSILNAGVFPILRRSNFFPVKLRLIHNDSANSYNKQIRKCLIDSLYHLRKEYIDSDGVLKTRETKGRYEKLSIRYDYKHEESLWEFFHRHLFYDEKGTKIQPVLVFDQFEEIFTLEKDQERVAIFFNELADLINNVTPDYLCENDSPNMSVPDNSIKKSISNSIDDELFDEEYNSSLTGYLTYSNFHIVLSIREDFLSYLERNIINIPLLKHNRYCLKPLSEDQAATIIMDPRPGLISKQVAKDIICKVTGAKPTDFEIDDNPEIEVDSAILSLFLSEIYEKKHEGDKLVSKELIEEFGDNIIHDFYERTIRKVSPECTEYLEKRLVTDDGRRDSIFEIRALNKGIKYEELQILKEQRLIREFPWNNEMRVEYMHDILCPIVIQRRTERKKLEEQKKKDYERLEEIRIAQINTEKLKRRNRQLLIGLIAALLSIVATALSIWDGYFREIDTRYGIIIKQNGWFTGLEKLSKEEASYRPCHYILKKKGRWAKHAYWMEARNGYEKLTTDHGFGAYILNQYDDTDKGANAKMVEKLKTVCQWEIVCNREGDFVVQERALDKEGNLVFCYNRTQTEEPNKVISTYADEYGFPIILRDSCYFYLRTTYDNRGFEILYDFFDDNGNPITNKDGAFQTKRTYLDNGIPDSEFSLFFSGQKMLDRFDNCGWKNTQYSDDNLRPMESISLNVDSVPCRITIASKTIAKRWTYDKHGRIETETYWNADGDPDVNAYNVHGYEYVYNRYGQTTHCYRIDSLGNKCKDTFGYLDYHREYDERGNEIISEMIAQDSIKNGCRYKYSEEDILLEEDNYHVYNGDTTYTYKYRKDTAQRSAFKYIAGMCCIREEWDEKGKQTLWAYYDTLNINPIECYGYHSNKIDYRYLGKITKYTDSYYDKNGKRCCTNENKWSYAEYTVDSIKNTYSIIRYDSLNNFYEGFKNCYTSDFQKKISEESLDANGNTMRTYQNGTFYYKEKLIYPIKPSLSSKCIGWYGINEFDEPSLVKSGNNIYYGYYSRNKKDFYFDENGHLKDDTDDNAQQPFLAYIEISVPNNKLGFQQGDVVLKCNNWLMEFDDDHPNQSFNDISHWFKNEERTFHVARFNEKKRNYDIIKIVIDKLTDIDEYIEFKKFYYTRQEKNRLSSLIEEAFYKPVIMIEPNDTTSLVYKAGLRRNAVLLEYNNWNCLMKIDTTTISSIIENNREKTKHIIYFDFDNLKARELTIDTDTLKIQMYSTKILPELHEYFIEQYRQREKTSTAQ